MSFGFFWPTHIVLRTSYIVTTKLILIFQVIKMLITILLVFLVCWGPKLVINIIMRLPSDFLWNNPAFYTKVGKCKPISWYDIGRWTLRLCSPLNLSVVIALGLSYARYARLMIWSLSLNSICHLLYSLALEFEHCRCTRFAICSLRSP